MDLVPAHRLPLQPRKARMRPATRAAQPLGRQQPCAQRQQTKPRLTAAFLQPQRVGNFSAEHLQTAANTHHGPAPLLQALTGKSAYTRGQPAALGLFVGSAAYIGGHGTATAWARNSGK